LVVRTVLNSSSSFSRYNKDVIYENTDYDVSTISVSKKRKALLSAYYISWKHERHIFDEKRKEIIADLEEKLPNVELVIKSKTKDENIMMVRTYSDRTLGDYYIYKVDTKELTHLHEVSPWLKKKYMAKQIPIKYTSSDGLTIHGYLTLPVGYTIKTAKNMPVVVNPHGGPWYRDSWGFNSEVQMLANRGYVVFQMNFRGSKGYGKKFWEASFGEWGLKMQDDITDGVNWLIDKGIADSERIAIYGSSYGGYAVLAGVTFTPDLYACGINYVGVSNLFTFFNSFPPYWENIREMMYEQIGHPEKDSLKLAAVSPALHTENIKVPLLIAQGVNDPRVNKAESDQIVDALRTREIEVEYIVKEDEGHGFRKEENRFEFYKAMEKFLKKYLK